ncbi:hypothetical protein [Candidatus Williamhamiltonella defendens]|uniref:Uncharacterized protein n=1 Tax=Candidatus Hamiltonella defensa (Bemisia tabaci) TaxID=672795 RepID=A0A249DY59_9ENTR|nr:hypothetical protein [Candidatus Hamiltonella defensa]ASX26289.1 hypothetical protein BA171_04165 [Candidatus Hamiltonella defensa (Bemisia tabaci)]CED79450.1 Conserved hypothetical protein [Candidatus Hamiltonella defensa (Bemisia tabaci)]
MNRIHIEGAIPLPPPEKARHQSKDGQDHEQKKKHFQHLLQPSSPSTQLKEDLNPSLSPLREQWADYHIVSGVLTGTVIRVSFAQKGFVVRLTCPGDIVKKRVLGLSKRWERELVRIGIPCFLEVSDATTSPP